MENIAVYCGSNFGNHPNYLTAAKGLAEVLVQQNIGLVYGGGAVGLMGAIADEVLFLGGSVTGVIPEKLATAEIIHSGLTELHIVKTMHERKELMAELADGFIALPGGIGTLEEIIEVFTWTQLGLHSKACGLLNIEGFYKQLWQFLTEMSLAGFLSNFHLDLLLVDQDPAGLIQRMLQQKIVYKPKWEK